MPPPRHGMTMLILAARAAAGKPVVVLGAVTPGFMLSPLAMSSGPADIAADVAAGPNIRRRCWRYVGRSFSWQVSGRCLARHHSYRGKRDDRLFSHDSSQSIFRMASSDYFNGALVGPGAGAADAVANGLPKGRIMRAQNLVSCAP